MEQMKWQTKICMNMRNRNGVERRANEKNQNIHQSNQFDCEWHSSHLHPVTYIISIWRIHSTNIMQYHTHSTRICLDLIRFRKRKRERTTEWRKVDENQPAIRSKIDAWLVHANILSDTTVCHWISHLWQWKWTLSTSKHFHIKIET